MIKRTMVSVGMLLAVTGCATNSVCDDYKKTLEVEVRVQGRWNALIEKKYDIAYTYFTDSYKSTVSEKDYKKIINPKIEWKAVDITRTRCSEEACDVHVTASYHMPPQLGLPRGMDSNDYIVEKWLRKDGEWWFIPPLKK